MDDSDLQILFERQNILNTDFSHEKHIRIAFIYLSQNSFEHGLELIVSGIKQLNAANKVPGELRTRGFHQTITIAWAKLVAQRLENYAFTSSQEFLKKYPDILNPRLLNDYYTTERLMSWEAKREFIEPDIKAFD